MKLPFRIALAYIILVLGPLAWLGRNGVDFDRVIPAYAMTSEGRYGVNAPVDLPPFFADGSDGTGPNSSSTLRLFEDGRELGPPHALHDTIRFQGHGAFSHWDHVLFFAGSDNSDPRTNHRVYHVVDRGYLTLEGGIFLLIVPAVALAFSGMATCALAGLQQAWKRRAEGLMSGGGLLKAGEAGVDRARRAWETNGRQSARAIIAPASIARIIGLTAIYSGIFLMIYCSLVAQRSQSGTFKINFEYKVF